VATVEEAGFAASALIALTGAGYQEAVQTLRAMAKEPLGDEESRRSVSGAGFGCSVLGVRLAARPSQRWLALQVELCSPRLIASRVETHRRPFGLSAGVMAAGPVQPLYSSGPAAARERRPHAAQGSVLGVRLDAPPCREPLWE
jgi:hypothetical protein